MRRAARCREENRPKAILAERAIAALRVGPRHVPLATLRLNYALNFVHTITFDNGKEFAAHQDIAHALKAKIFFATPYHAWERGLNENTNGLQGNRVKEITLR